VINAGEKRIRTPASGSSSLLLPSSRCKLLPKLRIARYLLHASRVYRILTRVHRAYVRACWHIERRCRTHASVCVCTHACIHSNLILLEATDAPISARVSFVIRENVNQSPGPHRLLFLRASSLLLYSLVVSRMYAYECVRANVYVRMCVSFPLDSVCLVSRTRRKRSTVRQCTLQRTMLHTCNY